MSKRKRNQSSTAGTDVPSSSKKTKVDREQSKHAPSHQSLKASKSLVASPDSKRQAPDAPLSSKEPQQVATSGLNKNARKRLRHRQRFRELKKNPLSGDKSEQVAGEPNGERPSQTPLAKPVSGKTTASHNNAARKLPASGDGGNSGETHVNESLNDRSPPAKVTASSKKRDSKAKRSKSVEKKTTLQRSNANAPNVAAKSSKDANAGVSKKQRRRQKLAQLKRDQASRHESLSKREHKDLDQNTLNQGKSTSPAEGPPSKYESPTDTSILHQTTQTTLMPVPKKQWIDEAEHDSPVIDASLRKEVTRTSLMPRPTKEWFEEDMLADAGDSISDSLHALESPREILTNATNASPSAVEPNSIRSLSASSAHSSPPSSPEKPQIKEAERPFAAVGLPPITQPSTTRPGINTIASFSLSSRRHPVDVLAKSRKISGLSGMRMDTGSIGSANKPVSSLKASSVPSYSGRGDVKAAFAAFNKFAQGGDSSASDDESDESGSESEAEVNKPAASKADTPIVAPSVTTEVRAPQNSQDSITNQLDSTAHTDNPTKSDSESSVSSSDGDSAAVVDNDEGSRCHETQESDGRVAETPLDSSSNLNTFDNAHEGIKDESTQSPNTAPHLPGQKALPLFSDFRAKHDIQPTDENIEHPATFLGQDLGGSPSGSGPGAGPTDDQRATSLQVPIVEYHASQDADDLYRSIEDISREVFGSTRALPDCKPLSNPLDVTITEPLVTDCLSGHGVNLQSLQQKTPDKAVSLEHIARSSSPIVYIVRGVDVIGEGMPDIGGNRLGDDDDEHNTESGPLVNKKAETERYSSPQSSLSTLTASPTPPAGSPNPTHTSIRTTEDDEDDENDEDPTVNPRDDPLEAADKKNRKMTGTSSKHFSPQKQPPKQRHTSRIKPESNNDTKDPALADLEEDSEPADHHPKPTKPKKKGTEKTSPFFTPTTTPTKPTSNSPTTTSQTKTKSPRPPAGTSTCPVPPTTSRHFGLLQEKLWRTPFWLLIAVTFLNKTTGRSAVPIFNSLRTLYPTPEALAQANHSDLVGLIATLGLQNQRARKLVAIARTWVKTPPVGGRRWRCLHYPKRGDGKGYRKDEVIEDDDDEDDLDAGDGDDDGDDVRGALEIAHIPGCGPYAWDSWRIFCRDVLRGRAEDYNGKGASGGGGNGESSSTRFVPEWQRVLPLDKELRACLRWMWLREGWVWDCVSGDRRRATVEERRAGEEGEMVVEDDGESKFAAAAAAAAGGDAGVAADDGTADDGGGDGGLGDGVAADHVEGVDGEDVPSTAPAVENSKKGRSRKMSIARRELDVVSGDEVDIGRPRRSRRKRVG